MTSPFTPINFKTLDSNALLSCHQNANDQSSLAQTSLGHRSSLPEKSRIDCSEFQCIEELIQQLNKNDTAYCLFLDIDGTLAEFCDDPGQTMISQQTLAAIKAIQQAQVPVFVVTGRQVEVAQQLFHPLSIPVAGLHGLDIALDHHTRLRPDLTAIDFVGLKRSLENACTEYPRLLLENKQHSFALHYRQCPELEPVAHDIMQQLHKDQPYLKLNYGKSVVEILPNQADKGYAIQTILAHFGLGDMTPIFIGDDVTDEAGFRVVNAQQGISIKVGAGKTNAAYRLQNVSAVAEFLSQFCQFLLSDTGCPRAVDQARKKYGEPACQD